jgi:hypothetical protein
VFTMLAKMSSHLCRSIMIYARNLFLFFVWEWT